MTIDEAIKRFSQEAEVCEGNADNYTRNKLPEFAAVCAKEATENRQLAEWLMELKDVRATDNEQEIFIHELMSELNEAKRLLKAAIEDFSFVSENFISNMDSFCSMYNHMAGCVKDCPMNSLDDYGRCKWRCTDEALKLIGEDEDER